MGLASLILNILMFLSLVALLFVLLKLNNNFARLFSKLERVEMTVKEVEKTVANGGKNG